MKKKNINYQDILSRYPKKRPLLSEEYKKFFNEHYSSNREGAGFANFISQKMESWMHKKVSKIHGEEILELGAGNLNHLIYEKNFSRYDIIEPFEELYKNEKSIDKITKIFTSTSQVDYKYDKIISIATLEHLTNLPKEIELCKKLLKSDGVLQIGVPCEGEIAFKIGWLITTGISFKLKYNLDYSKIMAHEHVNTIEEITLVLKENFKIEKFHRSPFILPFKNLSFYAYFECRNL